MQKFLTDNLSEGENGHLNFASLDVISLAEKFSTPCYLFDEDRIRDNCRKYTRAIKNVLGEKGRISYASKAASFKRIYEIMEEEGMSVDVVSCGEILTAVKSGFPMERAFFHSNNKNDEDITFAIDKGVGFFVVDNTEEIYSLDRIAGEKGIKQKILLRLTPGIDTHTFAAVNTGKVDSKFGFAIETGQAEEITKIALELQNVKLCGFHCHVGSQLFDSDVYIRSAEIMLDYIRYIKEKYGYEAEMLDLGGGYGVRYVEKDPEINISDNVTEVGKYVIKRCGELGLSLPEISFEPGRSIVADAGLTIYTVGSHKEIPGFLNYVSIDGGMSDNIRYALYGSKYTVLFAKDVNAECNMKCNLVGRCCESDDIIQCDIYLPESVKRGDIIAVCTTGAYNYSMASNYNRIPRPPIIMISGGKTYTAVKRETFEDLISLDV